MSEVFPYFASYAMCLWCKLAVQRSSPLRLRLGTARTAECGRHGEVRKIPSSRNAIWTNKILQREQLMSGPGSKNERNFSHYYHWLRDSVESTATMRMRKCIWLSKESLFVFLFQKSIISSRLCGRVAVWMRRCCMQWKLSDFSTHWPLRIPMIPNSVWKSRFHILFIDWMTPPPRYLERNWNCSAIDASSNSKTPKYFRFTISSPSKWISECHKMRIFSFTWEYETLALLGCNSAVISHNGNSHNDVRCARSRAIPDTIKTFRKSTFLFAIYLNEKVHPIHGRPL